jgi:dTDP-4-amino-4,6-dideoxy-D-galactose acyltransferase
MLQRARGQGIQLVVWPAREGSDVSRATLEAFGGMLADQKATFSRPLTPSLGGSDPVSTLRHPAVPYSAPTASPALCELAVAAGAYSRFHVDPHFSHDRFESMYRLWIERSVKGELADVVLVVRDSDGGGKDPLAGMITLAESGGVARIGLVAVAARFRGKGIGSALMHAAHRWMHDRRAREAQVVTQLANLPACRLYERAGYHLSRVQRYFHFWPLASSRSA